MTETTGEKTGISIKTTDSGFINTDKIASSLPGPLGSAASVFKDVTDATKDGKVEGSEIQTIASSGAGFVSSCMDVKDIATDPIGWLVGQGLNFLIAVVQPLQDAIHFVSGDGPALAEAAENFGNIGTGLADYSKKFAEDAISSLADWKGPAAEAAGKKLAEFSTGIDGIAGQAGDIAKLLQISSMIMTVIEEFIKALLTEFITWLIMIWIPALAAAVPTFGGSTAAAGTATTAKGAQTGAKATKQVSKLQQLLNKIQELLQNLKKFFTEWKTNFKKIMDTKKLQAGMAKLEVSAAKEAGKRASLGEKLYNAEEGMIGKRVTAGAGKSFGTTAKKAAADAAGLGDFVDGKTGGIKPPSGGKEWTKTGISVGRKASEVESGAEKAGDYGDIGDDQTREENSENLDF
ncbi:hypothetical protein [Amycolatopsis sp. NPDC059657]|uniref:hypothetical protein n=1 Tax=Amycolatopsis sp. NPDC059657 TaxID=3346899 RepID=UPI0036725616